MLLARHPPPVPYTILLLSPSLISLSFCGRKAPCLLSFSGQGALLMATDGQRFESFRLIFLLKGCLLYTSDAADER